MILFNAGLIQWHNRNDVEVIDARWNIFQYTAQLSVKGVQEQNKEAEND